MCPPRTASVKCVCEDGGREAEGLTALRFGARHAGWSPFMERRAHKPIAHLTSHKSRDKAELIKYNFFLIVMDASLAYGMLLNWINESEKIGINIINTTNYRFLSC